MDGCIGVFEVVKFHTKRHRAALMPKAISGQASAAELARFGALWQDRVRKMVVEHAADTAMVQVSDLNVA